MEKNKEIYSSEWFLKTGFEWTYSLSNVPDFDIEKPKHYLIESREKSFDKDSVRAYKSLKAFKYFEEGFVQKLKHAIHEVNDRSLYVISARVLASYQGKSYQTFVALDQKTSSPVGGACECVAGLGEACSHIAAILFSVEDYVAKGLNKLPGDKTCTDRLCAWNVPIKQNVEPDVIHNIRIVKQEHGKQLKERNTFDKINFDLRHADDRNVDESAKQTLVERLRASNPQCNFLRYSSVHTPKSTQSQTLSPQICALVKGPSSAEEIKSACEEAKSKMSVTENERRTIERLTIGQSDSNKWKLARQNRLTSSNFHRIFRMKKSTNPKSALESLLYKHTKQTAAMAFGVQQEEPAAKRYTEKTGVQLTRKGLVLDCDFPYLGASVDRITKTEDKIVEIKNPLSTWELTIPEAAKKLKCLKTDENNKVILNPSDEYYTQIQGQMGILGISKCDFVLCTKSDMLIYEVLFDAEFWNECKSRLVRFYENVMLPELVYPRVRYNLDPYVYDFVV